MPREWSFGEFESHEATVEGQTQTTDDLMGVASTWATRSTVGTSGVVTGSLQTQFGNKQEQFARYGTNIDLAFFPEADTANWALVTPGDRMVIGGTKYAVVWAGDEGGGGDSPVAYLKRTE